jgi:putative aldouronate transport system substrate-binding protein
VVFGPSEPQYKDYLTYIQKLYTEKLLDSEVLTRPGNPRDELLGRNVAGALHDWFASTADLNDKLASKIPGFNLRHFAPPVGTAKRPYTRIQMSKVRADGGWSISAKTKYAVPIIKMMDYLFSEEGHMLMNFGIEGVHYTMVNGKPKYTENIRKNPQGLGFHEALVTAGCQWKIGFEQDINYEMQFANAIATAARLDYMQNFIIEEFPALSFTERENEVLKDKYTHIKTFVSEMTARVMVGGMSIADWDAQVQKMKQMGLDEVTRIYQAAYNRKKK